MINKLATLLLIFVGAATVAAQTQVNAATQINWSNVSGVGVPTQYCPTVVSGSTILGSMVVALASVNGVLANQAVTGIGIPTGATVAKLNIGGTAVILSAPATSTASNVSLSFSSYGMPYTNTTTGQQYTCGAAGWALGAGGSGLTSFTSGNLAPLFTATLGANPTIAPALTFALSNAAQNYLLAGPASGSAGVPAYRTLVNADFPSTLAPTISAANMTAFPVPSLAGNITATTNSTLTTLPSLALPYAQLSGTVPTWNQSTTGNAATASALSTTGTAGTFWGSFGGTQQYAAVPTPHFFDVTSPVYGAVCNGVADDTAALAIASSAANGVGGTVYIPPVVGAAGIGTISGSTMSVTNFTAGTTYHVGQVIFGPGIPTSPPTTVTAIPSGGGVGNYTISLSTLSISSPITITGYAACMTASPLVVTNANLWVDGSIMASASIPSVVQWGSSTTRNNNHKIYGTGNIDTNNLAARAIDLSNYSIVEISGIMVYHAASVAGIDIGDTSNQSGGALIHNITVMNPAGSSYTTGVPGIWAHLGTDSHMDDITVIGYYYGVQNSVHNNLPFSNIHVWGFGTNGGWTGSNLPYTCFLDSFGQQTWAHDECDTAIKYGLEAASYETVVEDFLYYNNATWGSNGFVTGIEFDQTAGLGVVNGARFIGQSGHALAADVTVNGGNNVSSLQIFGVNESSYVNQESANILSTGGQAALVGNLTGSGMLKLPALSSASATNCLQVDTAGNITNTGTVCATPGAITGMLAGYIPIAATGTTIVGNAHLNDGVTTTNTLTATEAFAAPTINGVALTAAGSSSTYLNGAGSYTTPTGSGTVNSGTAYSPAYYPVGGGSQVSGVTPFTGIAYYTPSTPPAAAVAANVYGLWSGTCSASTFLRGDGTCASATGSTGLSGMTSGQVPIAASASTVAGSEPLAGSGAAITTGPASGVTSLDVTEFTGTGGQVADSGVAVGSLATLTGVQSLTNKTVDGVTPTTMGYLDATSSIQTQLNGKQASGAVTTVSVVTANGLQGTSSGGATPTLTLNVDSTHVLPVNTGSATSFLNQAGGYTTPAGTYSLPAATASVLGGVKPDGTTLTNSSGAISVTNPYNAAAVAITGGSIDGTVVGGTTPAAGHFTSVSTGGTTTAITGGTAGTEATAEGTAPTTITGSGTFDIFYGDSTLHAIKECANSTSSAIGTCLPVAEMPASVTTNDLLASASNGYGTVDTGILYTNVTQTTITPAANQICVYGSTAKTCTPTTTLPSVALPVVTTTVSSGSISAVTTNNTYIICTTTCNVTPLQAAAGVQLCVRNAPGSATVITLNALGASNYYELTTHAGWGTVNHAVVSGGAATDSICLVGYDTTHYAVMSYTGTWAD